MIGLLIDSSWCCSRCCSSCIPVVVTRRLLLFAGSGASSQLGPFPLSPLFVSLSEGERAVASDIGIRRIP